MKIAVLSDIHGNLGALDAVLDDLHAARVDLVVNLGDILSGALHPRETADRLVPLGWPTISGNHERQTLTHDPAMMRLSDLHAHRTLRDDQRRWIASLPQTLSPTDGVLMVHGTPASDLDYFLDTVTPDGLRDATREEVANRAGNTDARLILCGHTHRPGAMTLDDGRLIVNPGSVGLQAYDDDQPYPHRVATGSPHARYAIATRRGTTWTVDWREVVYDWDAAASFAASLGREDWAYALRTGRNLEAEVG